MRSLAAWSVYPLVLGVGLAACLVGLGRHDPAWVVGLLCVLGALTVALLERLLPFKADWNRSRGDLLTDAVHMGISMIAIPEGLRLGLFVLLTSLGAQAGLGVWPTGWPLLAQAVLAVLVGELGNYWIHRWSHEWEWLWRFHATHHSVERLYWLNAGRFHPVDAALGYLAVALPMVALGIGPEALAVFTVWTSIHGAFQHSNVDVRLGPLNWLLAGPELHRWHHARDVEDAKCNYGVNLILFDMLFGTRSLPEEAAPAELGISDMPGFPAGYLGQLASPFRFGELRERTP